MLSYWEHQSFFGPANVAIIGAGLVGLTAALYLKQLRPAWRVVVERGARPSGANTKNANFSCFGSVPKLMEQEKRGNLQAVVAARWAGLVRLRELVDDAALDYQPVGGYKLFRYEEEELAAEYRDKINYFNALLAPVTGQARTFRDTSAEAGRFGFGGVGTLLENEHEGSLDAGHLMRALLDLTWAADVPVLTNCTVEAIEMTATGPGLRPLPILSLPDTFHYDHEYAHSRQLPDQRILLGGGRNLDFAAEATTAPGLTAPVQDYLENLLREIIVPGRQSRIDFRWSGVMGFGPALAPIIDWVRPGVLAAVRCNGMGVALGAGIGWQAAAKLAAG